MYLKLFSLKWTLPEEIIKKIKKQIIQTVISTKVYFLFDLGSEKTSEFDNSIYSFVGCCSFGTGHLDLLMNFKDK